MKPANTWDLIQQKPTNHPSVVSLSVSALLPLEQYTHVHPLNQTWNLKNGVLLILLFTPRFPEKSWLLDD